MNVVPMPNSDEAKLSEQERIIEESGRRAYLERGRALKEVRGDGAYKTRLYKTAGFETFEAYCQERWAFEKAHVYRMIDAFNVADILSPFGDKIPSSESVARPLTKLRTDAGDYDKNAIIEVWEDAMETRGDDPMRAADVDEAAARYLARKNKNWITLDEWGELSEMERAGQFRIDGHKSFNKQDNASIEWAQWSWNPITGCKHDCPYCYARDIAERFYPQKFLPALIPERLTAARHTKVPKTANVADKNVFTCSMADLFGRWVPKEWIEAVMSQVAEAPDWNFLFLTKFPKRLTEFKFPSNAWLGTTVDCQARVNAAERAFAKVSGGVKWLSVEPMIEPLNFKRLDLFDWIVIGGASKSTRTPEWRVPTEWWVPLYTQARDAGLEIFLKDNLFVRERSFPGRHDDLGSAPDPFHYLGGKTEEEIILGETA